MFRQNGAFASVLIIPLALIKVSNAVSTELPLQIPPLAHVKNALNSNTNQANIAAKQNNTKEWLFKEYLKKYRPVNVWERLNKRKRAEGLNVSMELDFDELFDGIDPTDDLLKIKIHGKPESGRRKWFPPGTLNRGAREKDLFSLRRRFYELILHVMYWTRNKLVLMQNIRKKYRRNKLYRMGFMMSKTDIACKTFHRFAYRALHTCLGTRYWFMDRFYPIEILHAEERMNYKWFDIELLIDLITDNDNSCKSMLNKYESNRLKAWKFQD